MLSALTHSPHFLPVSFLLHRVRAAYRVRLAPASPAPDDPVLLDDPDVLDAAVQAAGLAGIEAPHVAAVYGAPLPDGGVSAVALVRRRGDLSPLSFGFVQ